MFAEPGFPLVDKAEADDGMVEETPVEVSQSDSGDTMKKHTHV